MDSLIDNNNSINDFFYEQDLYMKIRKIKIQNKKIGYLLFPFETTTNAGFINLPFKI